MKSPEEIKKSPLVLRVPMHDFKSADKVEEELLLEELVFARIPNLTQDVGYTHHVALMYKSLDGEVFSMTMVQHDGAVKEGTLEAIKDLDSKKDMPSFEEMGVENNNGLQKTKSIWQKITGQ